MLSELLSLTSVRVLVRKRLHLFVSSEEFEKGLLLRYRSVKGANKKCWGMQRIATMEVPTTKRLEVGRRGFVKQIQGLESSSLQDRRKQCHCPESSESWSCGGTEDGRRSSHGGTQPPPEARSQSREKVTEKTVISLILLPVTPLGELNKASW